MSTLYLVSTPIGNLADLSPRAEETLRTVDRILAEDTRRTRILTDRVGSSAPLISCHQHNERSRTPQVIGWLDAGEDLALVSDAGTPLLSDPGESLVDAVSAAGHSVVPIPGASAAVAALVASGLPTDRFVFLGFPDRKGRGRAEVMQRVAGSAETVVLFESPNRIGRLLVDLREACGNDRRAAVARELTKLHEEIRRGTLGELSDYYDQQAVKGEITVVVAAADTNEKGGEGVEEDARALARELLATAMRPSEVSKTLTVRLDLSRNDAYRIVQDLRGSVDQG